MDFIKEIQFSFGAYVIASQENSYVKNNRKARARGCIYLRASKNLQGGHRVLDLATGKVIERPTVTEVPMTDLVLATVNSMANEQGLKSQVL